MSKPIYVNDETFKYEVLQSETPVLVDFYADWCGPCRVIAPMIEEIAEEVGGAFLVAKLDIDTSGETAARYDIQSIPTLILFKDGKPVERWAGVVAKEVVLSRAARHVPILETVEH